MKKPHPNKEPMAHSFVPVNRQSSQTQPHSVAASPKRGETNTLKGSWEGATHYTMAVVLLLSGIVLCYLGFYKEPVGSISSSVLQYFAECLIWAASVFGLTAYVDAKLRKALGNENENEKSHPL